MLSEANTPPGSPFENGNGRTSWSLERLLAAVFLSWLGVLVCLLLLRQNSGLFSQICHSGSGCESVLSSRFSSFAGVPLPWAGLIFYVGIFILLLAVLVARTASGRGRLWSLALWLSIAAVTFSLLLMYVQFFVLRAFCPLCTSSAVIIVCLIALLARELDAKMNAWMTPRLTAVALTAFAATSAAAFCGLGNSPGDEVLAIVNEQKFTRAQMEQDLALQLQPLIRSRYALESKWLTDKVDAALIAAEAAKTGASPEAFLATRLPPEADIMPSEIDQFLTSKSLPATEESRSAALAVLRKERRESALAAILPEIASKHRVQIFLSPPLTQEITENPALAHISGPANAPVRLTVFSDFQCEFCAQLAPVLAKLRDQFPDQVLVAFRSFPLEAHPRAMAAAVAAECAAEQNAFWSYHDRLFANQSDLSDARFVALAGELGLDVAKFSTCLQSSEARQKVAASFADAVENGLEGAPLVFLNGSRVNGDLNLKNLTEKVEERLRSPANATR